VQRGAIRSAALQVVAIELCISILPSFWYYLVRPSNCTPTGKLRSAVELKKNLCRETFFVTFFEKKVRMLVQITPLAQGCPIETKLGGGCTAVGIFFKVYQPLVGLALGKERKS
jgi:hypothetical protein